MKPVRLIVAICSTTGPQSGKSTLSQSSSLYDLISCHMGRDVDKVRDIQRFRFSDPIVRALRSVAGDLVTPYEHLKAKDLLEGITGRDFMVAFGEGCRDRLGGDFFARVLAQRLIGLWDSPVAIIDDLRKVAEVDTLEGLDIHADLIVINVLHPSAKNNDTEFQNHQYLTDRCNRAITYTARWDMEHPGRFLITPRGDA